MRKPILRLLLLLLVVACACLAAQLATPAASAQNSGKNSDLTTLTGCLQSSSARYTLTDEDGTLHELSGGHKLGNYVGQQVEITGKEVTRTIDNTAPGGASSVIVQSVFNVKTVKKIADQCK